jgi:Cytochrome c7 and related cytochrome c/Class III cytochrome C family
LALGTFSAIFLFVLLLIACATPAGAQISPGPLAKAHQSLNGVLNCTKCHDLGARGGVQLKCLDCHTEIRDRLVQNRGMHAVWVGTTVSSKDCARCHSDHNGLDFPLVHWQPSREAMDHRQTGFPLTGKHAGLRCEECHNAREILPAGRAGIQVKDLNRTYLGLTGACTSCHQDEHRGQLGADCARCHTAESWKPAPGFNHATTKYPLTGAHATVACAKCHPSVADPNISVADAKPYVKYTGLSFATCVGCHSDPHKGAFKGTCESCHNTSDWKRVAQLEGFDHDKTDYPLVGKHRTVACSDCHNKGDFKTRIAFAKCTDCHADYHNRQFLTSAGLQDCAVCHTLNGFKPSTFGVKEHAASMYPLEGRHAEVKCEQCHIPKGKDTLFRITQTQCVACHEDVHKGQFAAAPRLNRCEECHNLKNKGWRPAVFALAKHKETRFPLIGAHIAVPCAQCHLEQPRGSITPVKYRFEDRSCTACHNDPHFGQFREQMAAKRADDKPVGCEACHTTVQWKELRGFDHAKTRFPLLGAHRGVACVDCHRPPNLETTLEHVDYRAVSLQCSGCHNDPHAGQFAGRKDATECSSCHNQNGWKPADFDHDTRTQFSLQGAHQNVSCAGCHTLTRIVAGRALVFYKPTPTKCVDCHGNDSSVLPSRK